MWLKIRLEGGGTACKRSCPSYSCQLLYLYQIYHILCVSSCWWLRPMCSLWPCWSCRAALKKNQMSTRNYGKCFFYNYSYLVPQNRPGSQTKATEKCIVLKYCRSLCGWHKLYLWFLLQLRVYTPVARCRPFLHGVMPEVIIISKNLNKTKGKEMSPVWTWKITPASQSIHVQACRECK